MAAIQLMIDQLEARASELEAELRVYDVELNELTARGKELARKADEKREQRQHYQHAANNLKHVLEIENPLPSQTAVDPWGDAA